VVAPVVPAELALAELVPVVPVVLDRQPKMAPPPLLMPGKHSPLEAFSFSFIPPLES